MYIKTCFALVCIALLAACNKKDVSPATPPASSTYPWLSSFVKCNCEADSTEYIRGYFNDAYMCFNQSYNDTFSNAYYKDTSILLDQLNMIRQNSTTTMSCQLYLCNTNLRHQSLPYTLTHPNLAYCEHAEITLLDFTKPFASACQGCETDDADYFGITWDNNFTLTVTDTTGGYLRGTFKGRIVTKTGHWVFADKGEFNIHIIDVNTHNQ